jgi:hypothetical protein
MIKITKKSETERCIDYLVEVQKDIKTEHLVTLTKQYYKSLTEEKISPEELVRRSFIWLLQKESNESILNEFDLKTINKYFPEYEDEIV